MQDIKIEFIFNVKNTDDKKKIENFIRNFSLVKNYEVIKDNYILTVNSEQNIDQLKNKIEKETGFSVALKGFGDSFSAVSEIHSNFDFKSLKESKISSIVGVIRLTQLNNDLCYVDGVMDNLKKTLSSSYNLSINEYGDLSGKDFEKVGKTKINILDKIEIENTTYNFTKTIKNCNLRECIGRSIVLNNNKQPVAAGIIARSSPVSGNAKKICQCSGKTIWEEQKDLK